VWTGDGFARDALRGFSPECTKMVRNDPLLEHFSQASKHEFPCFRSKFHPSVQKLSALRLIYQLSLRVRQQYIVTNTISWPLRPTIKISPDSLNEFLRSNFSLDCHPEQQSSAENASGADEIRYQNLHFRPRIGLFLHFRPSYAIFGSA
jgi:hypothetical protein